MIAGSWVFKYNKGFVDFTNNLSESKSEHAGDRDLSLVAGSPTLFLFASIPACLT